MHGTLAFSAAVMLAVLLAACDLGVPGCLGGGGPWGSGIDPNQ